MDGTITRRAFENRVGGALRDCLRQSLVMTLAAAVAIALLFQEVFLLTLP